jgi:hypothetical protein
VQAVELAPDTGGKRGSSVADAPAMSGNSVPSGNDLDAADAAAQAAGTRESEYPLFERIAASGASGAFVPRTAAAIDSRAMARSRLRVAASLLKPALP